MSLVDRVKDCKHYPRRVYVWKDFEGDRRSLHATCLYCRSDYHLPSERVIELVSARTPNDAPVPFYALLERAVKEYRSSLNGESPDSNLP